jgi:nucleoside-diphosphate-sugar epimerase
MRLSRVKEIIMTIVVIGGTGLIGSKLVNKLREHGHEAVAAAPNTGVNTLTGEGLAEVLKGASVVVDVSNSPSWEDAAVLKFFETSTRNLLTYEAAAGVGHHVALSVVGTQLLAESGYFRAKIAQEKLIKESSIFYSIVHATASRLVPGWTDAHQLDHARHSDCLWSNLKMLNRLFDVRVARAFGRPSCHND